MWTENLKINSPEWGKMNQRRGELIRKEISGLLTKEEKIEYEYLQKLSLEIINKSYPSEIDEDKEKKLQSILNSYKLPQ